ncbi:hypothetical protein [Streptacidiphilus sp. P02-A3a]|uniref:hypothetical protein n=1 Tax=Streptacidiphilus sp. P02-A3a TaxID=2704468 RepID=UPI0015FA9C87|nr:hypothetical protein [Streptacidiphilus sp. P02-A3a]QMU69762.1 hypothetical protein GXP74_17485 [Streptacidiphilus sp. P02-A3a]
MAVTCLLLAATGVAGCGGNSGAPIPGRGVVGGGSGAVPRSIDAALELIPKAATAGSLSASAPVMV